MSLGVNRNIDKTVDVSDHGEGKVNAVFGHQHSLDKHDSLHNDKNECNANPPDCSRLNGSRSDRLAKGVLGSDCQLLHHLTFISVILL